MLTFIARINKPASLILDGLLLAFLFIALDCYTPLIRFYHWKIYDQLVGIEYKFSPPPPAINDIVLVTIDDETLSNMPHRWPYPRKCIAQVIGNLEDAGARAIGFDFIFFGVSDIENDSALSHAFDNNSNIILASTIDEDGFLMRSKYTGLTRNFQSGIITKIQDKDGLTRRDLTFLVNDKDNRKGFLSWGISILSIVKSINLSKLTLNNNTIAFSDNKGEKWVIPVNRNTKSFLIHFRAHTTDFKRLSFYRAFRGDFNPSLIKGKIVLLGLASFLLGDLHNTSLGWIPGLTLNANSFLTLYAHDFLREMPHIIEYLVLIIGVLLSVFFVLFFKTELKGIFIILEVLLFFIVSYVLLLKGFVWNYFLFPITILVSSWVNVRVFRLLDNPKNNLGQRD